MSATGWGEYLPEGPAMATAIWWEQVLLSMARRRAAGDPIAEEFFGRLDSLRAASTAEQSLSA